MFCAHILQSREGDLGFGQGTGKEKQMEPVVLHSLAKHRIVQIAQGSNHSLVLTAQGRVYTWGMGSEMQVCATAVGSPLLRLPLT